MFVFQITSLFPVLFQSTFFSFPGTIFTSAALVAPNKQSSKSNRIKKKIQKLAIVFGRRLATTAYPSEKKRCVCIPRGPDGGGIIECDNWGSGPLAILVSCSFLHQGLLICLPCHVQIHGTGVLLCWSYSGQSLPVLVHLLL